jgi:hypothetical protein
MKESPDAFTIVILTMAVPRINPHNKRRMVSRLTRLAFGRGQKLNNGDGQNLPQTRSRNHPLREIPSGKSDKTNVFNR